MKKTLNKIYKIVPVLLVTSVLLLSVFFGVFNTKPAHAAQITVRSLTLQAGTTYGGSTPSSVSGSAYVNHFFQFTLPNTLGGNVGSILFEYCTLAAGLTCTHPTGLDTSTATYGLDSGATGFTIVNGTNGAPYITRTAAAIVAGTTVSYHLNHILNPAAANETFFVRISTFASTNTSGSAIDTGSVAASTAEPIVLTGTMPESLVFCTGATVSTTVGVPDCATATPGSILFNQLFSPTDTATAVSQMAASTNAGAGYAITVNGPTLTSGGNTVTGMAYGLGTHGVSQFGLNLKANTTLTSTVAAGIEVAPASNGTNYRGQAVTNFNPVDHFKYDATTSTTLNPVADSASGGAGGTDAQIYTVTYIVNVPGSQPAGTYTTTLTYICTPTF